MIEVQTEEGLVILVDPESVSAVLYDSVDEEGKAAILLKGSPHQLEMPSGVAQDFVEQLRQYWNSVE